MEENNINEIIERLRAEGSLMRNTGTNSIKSVKNTITTNREKISEILESVSDKLQLQTEILSTLAESQKRLYDVEKESLRDQARNERLKKNPDDNGDGGLGGFFQRSKDRGGSSPGGFLFGAAQEFVGSIAAMFLGGATAGAIAAKISTVFGAINLKKIIGRAGIAAFAGYLIEPIQELVKMGLDVIDESFLEDYRQEIKDGIAGVIKWGAIGSIFGKKVASIFALGGLIGSALEDDVAASETEIVKRFREEFGAKNVSTVAGIVASAFGFAAIKRAMKLAIYGTSTAGAGAAMKPILGKVFRTAFVASLALPALMSFFGDTAGAQVKKEGESDEMANKINLGISTAVLAGSMFGIQGALIGAFAGIAIFGLQKLSEWVEGKRDKVVEDVIKRAEKDFAEGKAQVSSGQVSKGMDTLRRTLSQLIIELERDVASNTDEITSKLQERIDTLSAEFDSILSSQNFNADDFDIGDISNSARILYEASEKTAEDYKSYLERMMFAGKVFFPDKSVDDIIREATRTVLAPKELRGKERQFILGAAENAFPNQNLFLPDMKEKRGLFERLFGPDNYYPRVEPSQGSSLLEQSQMSPSIGLSPQFSSIKGGDTYIDRSSSNTTTINNLANAESSLDDPAMRRG